jgi:hypothetical protein
LQTKRNQEYISIKKREAKLPLFLITVNPVRRFPNYNT